MTRTSTERGTATIVEVAGNANADRLETKLVAALGSGGSESPALIVDLSATRYVDVSALVYITSLIVQRLDRGFETFISLPKGQLGSSAVMHFLRAWRFPEALTEATAKPFESYLLDDHDRHYYRAVQKERPEPYYVGGYVRPDVGRILSERFFALRTFRPASERSAVGIPIGESNRWQEDLIRRVLASRLRRAERSPGLVGSAIVFESLLNALRHSQANVIQMVSRFDDPSTRARHLPGASRAPAQVPHFKLVVWDDGESSVDTLRRAAAEPGGCRVANVPKALHRAFWVVEREYKQRGGNGRRVESWETPNAASTDEQLLLATMFPGVTCDVSGTGHRIHPGLPSDLGGVVDVARLDADERQRVLGPGMGLYLLLNVAVDVFQGTVSYRTRTLSLKIQGASEELCGEQGVRYRAAIERLPSCLPPFRGNMLTVSLPLNADAAHG